MFLGANLCVARCKVLQQIKIWYSMVWYFILYTTNSTSMLLYVGHERQIGSLTSTCSLRTSRRYVDIPLDMSIGLEL